MALDLLAVALLVGSIFDRLNLRYAVGGAVAGTLLGEPRATHDLDLVAEIGVSDLERLLDAFEEAGFYVPRAAARAAVDARRSFNIVHRDSALKVDIFVAGRTALDHEELRRRESLPVSSDATDRLYVATAEDLVLQKLRWYREGGEVSDRQWRDVLGLVKAQGPRLDRVWLARWADRLGVDDLLRRAMIEAGQHDA